MFAMSLTTPGQPLRAIERPIPEPGPDQILIRVRACGVCRTDLHVVDGELPNPKPGIVPEHEVVGTVERLEAGVDNFAIGQRVGVPWLGWTCGACQYCLSGRENLRDRPTFTCYTIDGGYADYLIADQRYCFSIPVEYTDAEAAPQVRLGVGIGQFLWKNSTVELPGSAISA